jgi:UDP-2-acetamido-2,6-beta-L-arabino-hexul-4-ose reductase
MKILITGSKGFIGRNLCAQLKVRGFTGLLEYHRASGRELLDRYTAECDFVFHLAGINRPADQKGFEENQVFNKELLDSLKRNNNKAPVLLSSSTQAQNSTPYGASKKAGRSFCLSLAPKRGPKCDIPAAGVFGKCCRPNYNSVVPPSAMPSPGGCRLVSTILTPR